MHRDLGLGQREIARALEMGQATVHDYLRRWEASGLGWPLEAGLSDAQLEVKLFGNVLVKGKGGVGEAIPTGLKVN